ncbi:hypothetical protein BPUTSESOX_2420 [uncultured Gammaproteobacteria bacterium]|nr:hypothetical protein [uncultured Gammaproteobacteria bacterium]VVH52232.1 hypothetical protein BPUTSESOX_2420 [uncultured Gammaproteobacteria bacterium]
MALKLNISNQTNQLKMPIIERFNQTARQERLNLHLFNSAQQVKYITIQRLCVYNNKRPHFVLGGIPSKVNVA